MTPRSPLATAMRLLASSAVVAVALQCAAARAAGDVIDVVVDEAKVVALPEGVRTLIIGNPIVADVTLLKGGNTMVITGKGFGQTNLIALGADGNLITENRIRVDIGVLGKKAVVVLRGFDRETWFCNPTCRPTVSLGDTAGFTGATAGQGDAHNGAQKGAAAAQGK